MPRSSRRITSNSGLIRFNGDGRRRLPRHPVPPGARVVRGRRAAAPIILYSPDSGPARLRVSRGRRRRHMGETTRIRSVKAVRPATLVA